MKQLELVIATCNPNKVKEYQEIFTPFHINVTSMKEEGIQVDIDENGKTFAENSLIKAKAIAPFTNKMILADDSGLCINALDGFPGIYSARFMEGKPYEEKHQAILEKLKDKVDKSAYFVCAISLVNFPGEKPMVFEGKANGKIVPPRSYEHGFGYDPIFLSNEVNKTFAELSDEEKNKISHRGKATQMLLDFLKSKLGE